MDPSGEHIQKINGSLIAETDMLRRHTNVYYILTIFATLFLTSGTLFLAVVILQSNKILAMATIMLFIGITPTFILSIMPHIYQQVKNTLKYVKNALHGF